MFECGDLPGESAVSNVWSVPVAKISKAAD
jgi:hypothetical protein